MNIQPRSLSAIERAEVERMIEAYRLHWFDDECGSDWLLKEALKVISDLFDGKPPDLRFNALAAFSAWIDE